MENPKIEFPEVVGKSVAELNLYDDPDYGRELLIRFTDGTELSISVGVRQAVEARYYYEGKPDQPIFIRED